MNTQRKADPARVLELAGYGFSQASIASIVGVSRERIRQICNRDKIKTLSGKTDWDRLEALKALDGSVATREQVAKAAGYASAMSAHAAMKRTGITLTRPKTKVDVLRDLAESGLTLTEAAEAIGWTPQCAWVSANRARHPIVFAVKGRRGRKPSTA